MNEYVLWIFPGGGDSYREFMDRAVNDEPSAWGDWDEAPANERQFRLITGRPPPTLLASCRVSADIPEDGREFDDD